MAREFFDTATRGRDRLPPKSALEFFRRHVPQIVVSSLVVVVLMGGAFYASRVSEGAPKVVYTVSLDEVAQGAGNQPLVININTADAEELEELPEVGPATAEGIIEYRRGNGMFRSVSDLEEVPGIGPATLEQIRPFATV